VARRPPGTTDGGRTIDRPRSKADRPAAPGIHPRRSERWARLPVRPPAVRYLIDPEAPGAAALTERQERAAFARWLRDAESASGLSTDEWFAAIAGFTPPDARALLSGRASLIGYQEFCLQVAIHLEICPDPEEITPPLLDLIWGLRLHLTQLIPGVAHRAGGETPAMPPSRAAEAVPAAEPPGLPEGPLTPQQLQEALARVRAAVAHRMQVLAAVPGVGTARELQALAEWLFRREAALRAITPTSVLTQEEIQEAFAANLVRLRTAAGLTQGQLAERSGVSQPQISQLERAAQEPRLSTVLALARALGVEPAALLPGTDPPD
jgi:DNA-binding XRE family transcriptional regulator